MKISPYVISDFKLSCCDIEEFNPLSEKRYNPKNVETEYLKELDIDAINYILNVPENELYSLKYSDTGNCTILFLPAFVEASPELCSVINEVGNKYLMCRRLKKFEYSPVNIVTKTAIEHCILQHLDFLKNLNYPNLKDYIRFKLNKPIKFF